MSEPYEQHTPSIVAGLQRFWKPVLAIVLLAGVVGALYAVSTWKPTVAMTVGVDVATSGGTTVTDAARATSEVAAALASPAVVARAEALSGINIDDVDSFTEIDSSTVDVVVSAGSIADGETAARALVPAYQEITSESAQASADAQVAAIDEALIPLLDQQTAVGNDLAVADSTSGAYAQLSTQYQSLTQRIEDLTTQRSGILLAVSIDDVSVDVVSEPAVDATQMSSITRFVPVAMIAALLLCLLVIAVYTRRRPWLTSPEAASDILDAPLLAVGPRPSRFGAGHATDIGPAVGLGIQHGLPEGIGLALLLPVGEDKSGGIPADLLDRTSSLAQNVAAGIDRAGSFAVLAEVGGGGRTRFTTAEGKELESEVFWVDGSTTTEELLAALGKRGLDAEVVLVVPAADLGHGSVLQLVEMCDVIVPVVLDGERLEPLLTTRREMASLDRSALGLVVDPPE